MITGTYPYLSALAKDHACDEHPEELLVVVRRPEGTYALACGAAHWPHLVRIRDKGGSTMVDQDTGQANLIPTKEDQARQEEKGEAVPETLTLTPMGRISFWYLRLHQFYPIAVVATYPMSYDARSPAMLPSDLHAWVAEVFERPQGLMIAQGHGYASAEEEKEEGSSTLTPQWPWQRAEERAEISAISRAVPLGLEPLGKE